MNTGSILINYVADFIYCIPFNKALKHRLFNMWKSLPKITRLLSFKAKT